MQEVWFNRDLRLQDHAPLAKAAKMGPCLCIFVYEWELIQSDEFDASHLEFINESLLELAEELGQIGGRLTLRTGRLPDVFDARRHDRGIHGLRSHQETGNRITFERDRRVARWAQRNGIPWHQIAQNGVARDLSSRDGWARQRDAFMKRPMVEPPPHIDHPPDRRRSDSDSGGVGTAQDWQDETPKGWYPRWRGATAIVPI